MRTLLAILTALTVHHHKPMITDLLANPAGAYYNGATLSYEPRTAFALSTNPAGATGLNYFGWTRQATTTNTTPQVELYPAANILPGAVVDVDEITIPYVVTDNIQSTLSPAASTELRLELYKGAQLISVYDEVLDLSPQLIGTAGLGPSGIATGVWNTGGFEMRTGDVLKLKAAINTQSSVPSVGALQIGINSPTDANYLVNPSIPLTQVQQPMTMAYSIPKARRRNQWRRQ